MYELPLSFANTFVIWSQTLRILKRVELIISQHFFRPHVFGNWAGNLINSNDRIWRNAKNVSKPQTSFPDFSNQNECEATYADMELIESPAKMQ